MKIYIALTILIVLTATSQYKSYFLKDKVKCASMDYSQNQQFMVVQQGFQFQNGKIFTLPHCLYKKGSEGYELIAKQSFQKLNLQTYQTNFFASGQIQISKSGRIFISTHMDYTVRVFQNLNGIVKMLQYIDCKGNFCNGKLSDDGNTMLIVGFSSMAKIYHWQNNKFIEFQTINTARGQSFFQVCNDAIFSITNSQLNVYLRDGSSYLISSIKLELNKIQKMLVSQKGENGEYTAILAQLASQKQITFYHFKYLQIKVSPLKIVIKQTIESQISNQNYLLMRQSRNGQYFAFSSKKSQSVSVYGKKDNNFQLITKAWNFTQGPSDIYISQDNNFIAVSHDFLSDNPPIDAQSIAIFYKCNVPNCKNCSWSGYCHTCDSGQRAKEGKCSVSNNANDNQIIEQKADKKQELKNENQVNQQANNNDISNDNQKESDQKDNMVSSNDNSNKIDNNSKDESKIDNSNNQNKQKKKQNEVGANIYQTLLKEEKQEVKQQKLTYKQQIKSLFSLFTFLMIILFIAIYCIASVIKKICNFCGYDFILFQLSMKKRKNHQILDQSTAEQTNSMNQIK